MIMMYIDDVIFTSANIIVGLCRCVCVWDCYECVDFDTGRV